MPDTELSPCKALCAEDCITTIDYDGCPDSCEVCLYWERWNRNDCQWTPTETDKQYQHWLTRELPINLSLTKAEGKGVSSSV